MREEEMEEGVMTGRKPHTTGTGPGSTADSAGTSEDGDQRWLQQQKEADEQLLLDAGIGVDDMGDEEKRQILEALRESLPAPKTPPPSFSQQTLMSDHDKDRDDDEGPTSPEDTPTPPQSPPDQDPGEERMEVGEEPPPPLPSQEQQEDSQEMVESQEEASPLVQHLEVSPISYGTEEEEEEGQECDSTTVTALVFHDGASAAVVNPGLQERLTLEGGECGLTGEGDPSDSDSMSDPDTDLLNGSKKKLAGQPCGDMRLSSRQKEQGQSRFKELFNRTRLSQSQSQGWECSQLAAKEVKSGDRSVPSSQDLFPQQSPSEGPGGVAAQPDHRKSAENTVSKTHTSHPTSPAGSVTRSTPSPPSPPQEERSSPGDRGEGSGVKEGVCLEDIETLPPEDWEEEEEEREEGGKDGTSGRSSPVYPMHVTQVSCSSPSPDIKTGTDHSYLTPSKLPVEDAKDRRPLLHDNWFTWLPVPPVCCLHRTYSHSISSGKRKEVDLDPKPYFCGERESVSAYSEVILRMLDSYLQQFTAVQGRLHPLLPWGKPVRAGMHQPGSIDLKRRGQPELKLFDLEEEGEDEDDDSFKTAKPQRSRPGAFRRKRRISDDDDNSHAGAEAGIKVKVEVGADDEQIYETVTIGDRGDGSNDAAAYDGETQPMDSENELPDLLIETAGEAHSSWAPKAKGGEKGKAPSPTPVSEDSQSSGSLLNEQGDLYSTQLPRRKRAGQVEGSEAPVTRPKRPRRALQSAEVREKSPEKVRPLSRKRKQAPQPSSVGGKVLVVGDDEEREEEDAPLAASKEQAGRKRLGFVNISSKLKGAEGRATVVQPTPGGRQSAGSRTGRMAPFAQLRSSKQTPQASASSNVSSSSSSQVRGGGGGGEEDSDDSVQYLGPSTYGVESAPTSRTDRQRSRQVEPVEEEEKEEEDHSAVPAVIPLPLHPEGSAGDPSEELIPCPLCNKLFPSSVIERHASDCSLEMEAEEPPAPHHSTAPLAIPPTSQLRRRPLRGEPDREDHVCGLCNIRQRGSVALKQHFEQCQRKYQREEASSSSGQDLPSDTKRANTASLKSADDKWLTAYKIPRKVEGAATSTRLSRQTLVRLAKAEVEDVVEEASDDSDKDPPFRPSEEDRQQEKDDRKENRRGKRGGHAPREHSGRQ